MSDLVDGATVPWHFVYGEVEPPVQVDPLVQQRVQERRAAAARTELPPPATREPITTKRLVAGGMFVAHQMADHWRRGRS